MKENDEIQNLIPKNSEKDNLIDVLERLTNQLKEDNNDKISEVFNDRKN